MNHSEFMHRCLQLAKNGKGNVAPNPLVGAVLVHDGKIIAEGYHQQFGSAHAEVNALKDISDSGILQNSTLYVNLEPCSHYGKTPPCTGLVIDKGIKHVVIANSDPNPLVAGNGITALENHQIEVTTGVLEKEGAALNKRFFTFHVHKRPYIILKWAQTVDRFIAPAHQSAKTGISWISNETSRLLNHKWRSREQAILVGNKTVISDNPELTTRHFSGNNPIRIVVDPHLKLNTGYKVYNQESITYTACLVNTDKADREHLLLCRPGDDFIPDLLNKLYELNIQSIIIEGGSNTLNKFIASNLWDEARIFTSEKMFNEGISAPDINGELISSAKSGTDTLEILKNQNNQFL